MIILTNNHNSKQLWKTILTYIVESRDCRGRMVVGVASSNPAHGEVYSIQHYVIKVASDLRHVGGLLWILQFRSPILLTAMI